MNLLIVFHSLYSLAGGVDNRLSELEVNLPDTIHRQYLLFKNEIDLPHKGKVNVIKSISIPQFVLKNKQKFKLFAYFYGFFNLLLRVYQTRKFIKKRDFNTILAVDDYFALIVVLATLGMDVKIVSSVRNNWDRLYSNTMIHLLPDFMYTRVLVWLMNQRVSSVHCVSEGLSTMLKKKYKVNNTVSIYNLFDMTTIRLKANDTMNDIEGNYLINIGHFNAQKNQKDLILSYAMMRKEGLKEKLVLVGDGLLRNDLEHLVQSLDLQQHVIFVGKQSNPYKYLKNASLYVSTSLYEGLPAVFVEALILQVPIVSYSFDCGSKELASNIVEMSPHALKIKVLEIITNDTLKKEAINKGNDILTKRFESKKIINSWLRILS